MFRFVFVIYLLFVSQVSAQDRLLVFAAASQKDALEAIIELYEERCGCEVVLSVAATSTLARQIEAGAKADVFISANEAWADWLEIRKKISANNRAVVAGNRLVIVSAAPTRDSFNILFRGKFSMADPISVPAGVYAREALEEMGLWQRARKTAVFSENVRVALAYVKRGDLLSGIVYQSDLRLTTGLHSHFVFPEGTHSPIHYVAGVVVGSDSGSAFVEFLTSDASQRIFEQFGFLPASSLGQK